MNRDTEELTERAPSHDRDGRAAYRVVTDGRDLTAAIVSAVSEVADCDDLVSEGDVLYDVIDPDALERLFADCHDGTARTAGHVVFELRGCRVEVHADGNHVVYEPVERRDDRTTAAGSV